MKIQFLRVSLVVLAAVLSLSFAQAQQVWVPFDEGTDPASPEIQVLATDMSGITLKFTIPGMFRTDRELEGETYQLLNIPGGGHTAEIGSPEVPTVGRYIAIPCGASVSIEVIGTRFKILEGYNVYPTQEPRPDDSGFDDSVVQFQKNFQTYSTNTFYPASIAEVEQPNNIRDLDVSVVGIFPVRFNPVSRQVEVYSEIEVRVRFDGGYGYFVKDKYRSVYFEPLYKNLLLNYDVLGAPPAQAHPVDYLVITYDKYYGNIIPLANWKHKKGVSTRILRVPYDVAANAFAIKDSIQYYYDNYGTSFVLLVGDAGDIPPWYITTHPYHGSKTATDLYYSTISGIDYFPDIFVGRIPVDDSSSAQIVINKILNYEKDPYLAEKSWYDSLLVAACYYDSYPPYGVADRFFLETKETIAQFLEGKGYDVFRVYTTNCTAPLPWYYYYGNPLPPGLVFTPGTGTSGIIDIINDGVFLVNYRSDGVISGWGDPMFYISHISSLTNGRKLPVVFSVACQTCWFDYSTDCFGEALLKWHNGGCVGIIGATRVTYSGYNDELDKGFFDAVWPDFDPTYPTSGSTNPLPSAPYYDLGIILNFAKFWMYDKYFLTGGIGYPWTPSSTITLTEFEMYNLFGCPEMSLWTHAPKPMTVTHPNYIPIGATSELTVTAQSDGHPVEDALVCLYKQDEVYERAFTPASGQVTFFVTPATGGPLYVTVTGQNYQPYEGIISGFIQGTLAGKVTNANTGLTDR